VVLGETTDEARERDRLVHHDHVVGQEERRHQNRGGLAAELIGDVTQDGGLTPDMRDQFGPDRVLGDDPVEIPGVQGDPVVEGGSRAGNDAQRSCRDRGVNAEEMSQDVVGVPPPSAASPRSGKPAASNNLS
jgi:hypothetical protein